MSVLGKVLRAAIVRPWEFEDDDAEDAPEYLDIANGGAPGSTEFRVSPDGSTVAMWIKSEDKWVLYENVIVTREYRATDPGTLQDWTRYLEVEEVD